MIFYSLPTRNRRLFKPGEAGRNGCFDGDACTVADACQSGICTGAVVVCMATDECHQVGTCSPATGTCSNPVRPDGAVCDDVNGCTTNDACSGGVCAGVGDPLPQVVDDDVRVSRSEGVATITWTPAADSAAGRCDLPVGGLC